MPRRAAAAALMTTGLVLAPAGAAVADPAVSGDLATLICDNGETYTVAVNGNGEFTPAHDVDSTHTLVATSFGATTITLATADGTVIDTFGDPPSAKGGQAGKDRATTTACDFQLVTQFPDEELGILTLTVNGTVTGFVTPL